MMGRNWLSHLQLDWKSLTQSTVHRVDGDMTFRIVGRASGRVCRGAGYCKML